MQANGPNGQPATPTAKPSTTPCCSATQNAMPSISAECSLLYNTHNYRQIVATNFRHAHTTTQTDQAAQAPAPAPPTSATLMQPPTTQRPLPTCTTPTPAAVNGAHWRGALMWHLLHFRCRGAMDT